MRPPGLRYANSAVGHVRRAGGDDDRVDREILAQVAPAVAVLSRTFLSLSDCRLRRALATSAPMRSTV